MLLSRVKDWKYLRGCGRTLTQGHFCTNGGCLALLESHQAWLKRKLCSTCLIFKAVPALSQGLGHGPLVGSKPICCCKCHTATPASTNLQVLQVSVHTPRWLLGCLPAHQGVQHKMVAGWCHEFHMSLGKCQERDSAHHNPFVEETHGQTQLCGAM